MKFSENTNELDAALALFQGEMPPIKKDVNVKMNGMSKSGKEFKVDYDYAPLDSIQTIANPITSKHGLNITQDLGYSFSPKGDIVHEIHTRVAHKSGQWKVSVWPLDMSGVTKEQDRGSKITFNKRYAYAAALNIILVEEDNDAIGVQANINSNATRPPSNQKPQQVQKPNPAVKTKPEPIKDPPPLNTSEMIDAEYVFNFGTKYKGKKISEVSADDLHKIRIGLLNLEKLSPEQEVAFKEINKKLGLK